MKNVMYHYVRNRDRVYPYINSISDKDFKIQSILYSADKPLGLNIIKSFLKSFLFI